MVKSTIWKDKMGSLHIFLGYNKKLSIVSKYLAEDTKGEEANVFLQSQSDVESFEQGLTKNQMDNLNNGFQINAKVDELYFDKSDLDNYNYNK